MRKAFGILLILIGIAIIPLSIAGFIWLDGMACAFGTASGSCPPPDFTSPESLMLVWFPSALGVLLIALSLWFLRKRKATPATDRVS